MSVNNPYAQAGWANPANPWSVNEDGSRSLTVPPCILGALPSASRSPPSPLLSFQFSGMNPDILNCIVMGPNARHCYSITTSASAFNQPSVTLVRNDKNAVVARVEWHQHPVVEVENMLPRCLSSQLIPLASDMSYRTMMVKGKSFAWLPHKETIRLYNTGYNPAELVGSLTRQQNMVNLNVAADAIHAGMLEVCVTITLLLYSGRNID